LTISAGEGAFTGGGALVPLGEPAAAPAAPVRPLCGFLAQLVACREGMPAFRARRRAAADLAAARYAEPPPARRPRFERLC
jgi:hypothetical protein